MAKATAMPVAADTAAPVAAAARAVSGTVRLCPLADLAMTDREAWRTLGPAADANVFAQPWVVEAGLRHCADGPLTLAMVSTEDGQVIGVAPLVRRTRLGRVPLGHWQIWTHPNSFCAPILIRNGQEQLFWDLLLAHLGNDRGMAALAIADCALDSTAYAALARLAAQRGLRLAIVEQHERALASGTVPLASYWDTHVRAKKRKELRRQAARLAELGVLSTTALPAGEDAGPWIDEFLALERLGWKGAAGSALATAPGTTAYFRDVVAAAHAQGSLSFLALRLDGRAIAMLVTLFDGDAAFSFKTAYDESLARFSPGVQIQRDNLLMLAARGVRWADSCAAADHPMIDSIWAERRPIGTVAVALPGLRSGLTFAAYCAALQSWRRLKAVYQRSGKPR